MAVSAAVEVYNFIIFQSILQEVLELGLTLSNVAEPPDPLPFYLFIRIDEFVQGPVYLMFHLLLDVEFQVSPVPPPIVIACSPSKSAQKILPSGTRTAAFSSPQTENANPTKF